MIARRWHGRVPAVKAEEYLRLMEQVGLPDYRSTDGNRGAWCLHRRADTTPMRRSIQWDPVRESDGVLCRRLCPLWSGWQPVLWHRVQYRRGV